MSTHSLIQRTRLSPENLIARCDIKHIPFATSDEVKDPEKIVGQDRAMEAIHFGTRIKGQGYNMFAFGASGTGKFSVIERILKDEAKTQPTPSDWCYVYNFDQPYKPDALELPFGRAVLLKKDMIQLVEDLKMAIPAALESDEYRSEIDKIQQGLEIRRNEVLTALAEEAKKDNIQLIHTPNGFAFAPLDKSGEVIIPDAYEKLSREEQEMVERIISELQKSLQQVVRQFPIWQKEVNERLKGVDRATVKTAIGHLFDQLCEKYNGLPPVLVYLSAVGEDIVENFKNFQPQQEAPRFFGFSKGAQSDSLEKYSVNVIVDHSVSHTAPVVYQDLPNHSNLMGRAEYRSEMGTLQTDFTLIKAGDLHRANGGYLILDARQILTQPHAWQSLKRSLRSREIRIEPLERTLGLISTVSLDPEPIPLSVKVVLMGDHQLYYLLNQYDPEFKDLFKVAADFDNVMSRSPENCAHFARLVARMVKENDLRPIDDKSVAKLIEHGSRMTGDSTKISTHLRTISDILREADYWSSESKSTIINANSIQKSISQRIHRLDRIRSYIYEAIETGVIKIEVAGSRVGQVNGLSVIDLGEFAFGQPSRITGTSRFGASGIVDIERETNMGGSLHSKGVLILSSFLTSRYALKLPLSLSASLVFEQSYGKVDGDSASLAELCVLLSSLSNLPIQQRFAMTGSVDQHGQVQAIGGVNQKIEGFFDVCLALGLDGTQGVLIPRSNIKHLMLREDVIEAVEAQNFHIHAVESVDQAIEILTETTAGERDSRGYFVKDSVNAMVEERLIQLANLQKRNGNGRESTPRNRRYG